MAVCHNDGCWSFIEAVRSHNLCEGSATGVLVSGMQFDVSNFYHYFRPNVLTERSPIDERQF